MVYVEGLVISAVTYLLTPLAFTNWCRSMLCSIYTVYQKYKTNLASCSFDKHGLILSKRHQHTFRNYMHVQLSLSLHFCLLYLLLNDVKRNMFSSVDYWWL